MVEEKGLSSPLRLLESSSSYTQARTDTHTHIHTRTHTHTHIHTHTHTRSHDEGVLPPAHRPCRWHVRPGWKTHSRSAVCRVAEIWNVTGAQLLSTWMTRKQAQRSEDPTPGRCLFLGRIFSKCGILCVKLWKSIKLSSYVFLYRVQLCKNRLNAPCIFPLQHLNLPGARKHRKWEADEGEKKKHYGGELRINFIS